MLTGHLYRHGRATDEPVDPADVSELLADEGAFVWLDAGEPTDADLEVLAAEFGLHPLTLEDLRHRHQRPKVELYQDYAYMVLRPLVPADDIDLRECEVHALVGRRFLVTLRYEAAFTMERVTQRWDRQPELLELGGGFAAYVLVDEVVDDYLTLVERFEDRADDLEDSIFDADGGAASDIQERLFRLKRETVRLRRFAMPLRQGLDLIQEQPQLASSPLAPYYRDVVDHVIRVVELVDNIRDLLTSMLEVRVAQVANRMNDVMKKLTAWAAIILVPTLIAGIYGMNFEHMPELSWKLGYPLALGTMAASALLLYRLYKKRGWL